MLRFGFGCVVCLAATLYALPAFPGAEGYGAATTHGRGGKVLFVTNTASAGAGSLRLALETAGPRIIVFRTSGVINLSPTTQWYLESANYSNFMVAGQTSPGGITLTAGPGNTPFFQYSSCALQNYVWRFIRFRVQGTSDHAYESYKAASFVLDHCDFSGGTDEITDLCYCHDFTIQWCAIGNAPDGGQNYGTLIAYSPMYDITLHHLLWADVYGRNGALIHFSDAAPPNNGMIDYRNNVSYDFGNSMSLSLTYMGGPCHVNYVGNFLKAGPHTGSLEKPLYVQSEAVLYQSGNVYVQGPGDTATGDFCNREYGKNPGSATSAYAMPAITTTSAQQAYRDVLDKVGAWPRDAMATRTVNDVRNNTGQYGKLDDALITSGPAAAADADNDGMPDFWETGMGFNPNDSSGRNADQDGDGYTNIEEYVNDLALARICQDYYNPVYPIPSGWPDYNPSCCQSLAVERGISPAGASAGGVSVFLDFRKADAVFDLTGRRIAEPRRNGIFIYRIQGKFLKRVILR